uniref:Transmembrane protein n=1 Tax=Anguilla anguilla TaxID=7936 RepID=A0A0E9XB98_ANGAN
MEYIVLHSTASKSVYHLYWLPLLPFLAAFWFLGSDFWSRASVSLFSIFLSCFFFILFILVVFRITCTISALRSFASRLFRFSSLRFLLSSFSLAFSSLSCRVNFFTSSFSLLASIFFSQEERRGLSRSRAENLCLFRSFHTRPDLGLPRGIICCLCVTLDLD